MSYYLIYKRLIFASKLQSIAKGFSSFEPRRNSYPYILLFDLIRSKSVNLVYNPYIAVPR
jgi:hypothetical protein